MRRKRSAPQQVSSITSAGLSHSDDIALRQKRYVMTQSVRILCVLLAASLPAPLPFRILFLFGAVLLPWFGVVMANAGPVAARRTGSSQLAAPVAVQPVRLALEPGRVIDAER